MDLTPSLPSAGLKSSANGSTVSLSSRSIGGGGGGGVDSSQTFTAAFSPVSVFSDAPPQPQDAYDHGNHANKQQRASSGVVSLGHAVPTPSMRGNRSVSVLSSADLDDPELSGCIVQGADNEFTLRSPAQSNSSPHVLSCHRSPIESQFLGFTRPVAALSIHSDIVSSRDSISRLGDVSHSTLGYADGDGLVEVSATSSAVSHASPLNFASRMMAMTLRSDQDEEEISAPEMMMLSSRANAADAVFPHNGTNAPLYSRDRFAMSYNGVGANSSVNGGGSTTHSLPAFTGSKPVDSQSSTPTRCNGTITPVVAPAVGSRNRSGIPPPPANMLLPMTTPPTLSPSPHAFVQRQTQPPSPLSSCSDCRTPRPHPIDTTAAEEKRGVQPVVTHDATAKIHAAPAATEAITDAPVRPSSPTPQMAPVDEDLAGSLATSPAQGCQSQTASCTCSVLLTMVALPSPAGNDDDALAKVSVPSTPSTPSTNTNTTTTAVVGTDVIGSRESDGILRPAGSLTDNATSPVTVKSGFQLVSACQSLSSEGNSSQQPAITDSGTGSVITLRHLSEAGFPLSLTNTTDMLCFTGTLRLDSEVGDEKDDEAATADADPDADASSLSTLAARTTTLAPAETQVEPSSTAGAPPAADESVGTLKNTPPSSTDVLVDLRENARSRERMLRHRPRALLVRESQPQPPSLSETRDAQIRRITEGPLNSCESQSGDVEPSGSDFTSMAISLLSSANSAPCAASDGVGIAAGPTMTVPAPALLRPEGDAEDEDAEEEAHHDAAAAAASDAITTPSVQSTPYRTPGSWSGLVSPTQRHFFSIGAPAALSSGSGHFDVPSSESLAILSAHHHHHAMGGARSISGSGLCSPLMKPLSHQHGRTESAGSLAEGLSLSEQVTAAAAAKRSPCADAVEEEEAAAKGGEGGEGKSEDLKQSLSALRPPTCPLPPPLPLTSPASSIQDLYAFSSTPSAADNARAFGRSPPLPSERTRSDSRPHHRRSFSSTSLAASQHFGGAATITSSVHADELNSPASPGFSGLAPLRLHGRLEENASSQPTSHSSRISRRSDTSPPPLPPPHTPGFNASMDHFGSPTFFSASSQSISTVRDGEDTVSVTALASGSSSTFARTHPGSATSASLVAPSFSRPPAPPPSPYPSQPGTTTENTQFMCRGFATEAEAHDGSSDQGGSNTPHASSPSAATANAYLLFDGENDPQRQEFAPRLRPEKVRSVPRGKIARGVGFSMHDWSGEVFARQKKSGAATLKQYMASLPRIRIAEIVNHNHPDDLWMVVRHVVYDCTKFAQFHPGGARLLLECGGKDATQVYDAFHPWIHCESMMGAYAIGILAEEDRAGSATLRPNA